MKISKATILGLWSIFTVASVWLMVFASEKNLSLDLNNAIQHIEIIEVISTWYSSNSTEIKQTETWHLKWTGISIPRSGRPACMVGTADIASRQNCPDPHLPDPWKSWYPKISSEPLAVHDIDADRLQRLHRNACPREPSFHRHTR